MGTANTVQTRFRWRNDNGTDETDATWKALINTNWTPGLSDLDVPIRLRVEMSNTGSKVETSGPYEIWLDVDSGGYNKITTTSTNGVQMVASAVVSDGTATTEQFDGSGTFQAGEFDSNGAVSSVALTNGNDMEMEYCFKLDSGNLSGGESLSFRVYLDGVAVDSYTNTPSITAPTPLSGEWTQAEFRIRASGRDGDSQLLNDNLAGDWAFASNTSGTLEPGPERWGTVFGLRFKVSAAVASGSKTLKIQSRLNSGTWTDMNKENHNDQAILANSRPVGVFPTLRYTDGTATTQLLSGSSFVAGTGEHDPTAASVTLGVGDHTELEWRIYINKLWDACGNGHVDGDYYDFRLVESDGTLLTAYTNTPRITLNYDNNYLGGCFAESHGDYGIFVASDGDAFAIIEECELTGRLKAMKRASGTTRWIVVDNGNEPSQTTGMADLEGVHIQQIGNTLHIFNQGSNGTRYETFDMSTDSWGGLDEQVDTTGGGTNQQCFGARRSDGTTICFYVDVSDDLVYKERSVGGTWDTSPTTFKTGTVYGSAGVLGASDKIHMVWSDSETEIFTKSLSSSNVQGTERSVTTDPYTTGSGVQWSLISPVYWDDSGNEKIGVIYQKSNGQLYWKILTNDSSLGSEAGVSDVAVENNYNGLNSRHPAANAVVDGTTTYVGFAIDSTGDIYYTSSSNGAAFATDTEVQDGIPVAEMGLYYDSGTLYFLTEEANPDDVAAGYTGGISVVEQSVSTSDDLTANSISSTPVVGTPSIGQTHVLDANDISSTPVVDNPTITSIAALDANDISTTPVVGQPTLATIGVLDANDISTTPIVDNPTLDSTAALDANDISTTPVLEQPTVGQTHPLDANDISTTPVVDNPTIGQTHVLDATAISTTPEVGQPTIGQTHVLDANDISTTPVLETPTLDSVAALDANNISTTPVVDNPTVASTAALDANDISTTPVVGTPTIGTEGEDNLTANSINTTPVVGTPTIGQTHVLDASDISTTPVLETPTFDSVAALDANGLSSTPVVGTPTIGQTHVLDASDISTTPVVDNPTLGTSGVDNLDANSILTTPVVGNPAIGQTHVLDASGVLTTPVVDNPTLSTSGQDDLTANSISTTPVVGTPTIGQTHVLDASDISTTPVVDNPTLSTSGQDDLTANSISTTPEVGTPTIGQVHILSATGISTTPEVGTPAIGQIHTLDANDISTTPVLETPTASHVHVLSATGITTIPEVGTPSIGQVHALDANTILVSPLVGTPSIGQTHILTALGIITVPSVGTPSWDLVEGVVVIEFSTIFPETSFSVIKPEIEFTIPMED